MKSKFARDGKLLTKQVVSSIYRSFDGPIAKVSSVGGSIGERLVHQSKIGYIIKGSGQRPIPQMTFTTTPETEEAVVAPAIALPISREEKTTILLNVEGAVKDLAAALAKKQEVKGVEIDEAITAELPRSLTGVLVHYFCKGIKEDFGIEFAEEPVSLKQRGGRGSQFDKKVAGKKRLLTREQKNELIAKTQMSFYEKDIATGKMTLEQAMFALKDAYERKATFEEMGYMLPQGLTKYPYWVDEVGE